MTHKHTHTHTLTLLTGGCHLRLWRALSR
jgi:hypothetical protein